MKEHLYLTFTLSGCLYGIDKNYVQEIFELPEFTPLTQTSSHIIGVTNLRGEMLPVIDINRLFGYEVSDYRLTDNVVVLKWKDLQVGIIVNEIHELKNISPEEINAELSHAQKLPISTRKKIIAGIYSSAGDVLILNNPEYWLRDAEIRQVASVQYLQNSSNTDQLKPNNSEFLVVNQSVFCPNATSQERAIFQKRAEHLRQSTESQDLKSLRTLAVIGLKNELFGIDVAVVREFTDIYQVTPIPCCPAHIIGNMNLRGEILTLVDIRGFLNLPRMGIPNSSKAMVVEVEGIVAGVMVEEIYDVLFFLNPQEIMAVSTAMRSINDEYIQGTASYQEKMMYLLDLPKIFFETGFIIDEVI